MSRSSLPKRPEIHVTAGDYDRLAALADAAADAFPAVADFLADELDRALVYPEEADITAGRLSVLTPVGVALIGLRKGQTITWITPSGKPRNLTVMRVEPAVRPAAA
jgi:regulator of nucleoside diphosphate kinase